MDYNKNKEKTNGRENPVVQWLIGTIIFVLIGFVGWWIKNKVAEKLYLSKNYTQTVNEVNFEMIGVDGGTFEMGKYSVHEVSLSNFSIGKYEVTQGLWVAVMGNNPSEFKKGDNYPIENVNWNDCLEFIKKLNTLTGKKYRLPTEAEWEFAARGGTKSKGYEYSGSNDINAVAWNSVNSEASTHQVGAKKNNELGLYDMTGNVWEWCADFYDENFYKSAEAKRKNPINKTRTEYCVIRGGSLYHYDYSSHVADRYYNLASIKDNSKGFRIAISSDKK